MKNDKGLNEHVSQKSKTLDPTLAVKSSKAHRKTKSKKKPLTLAQVQSAFKRYREFKAESGKQGHRGLVEYAADACMIMLLRQLGAPPMFTMMPTLNIVADMIERYTPTGKHLPVFQESGTKVSKATKQARSNEKKK